MPPAASPRPPPPSPRACLNKCHGATCGSFLPYTCAAFEQQGCDCSGCCGSDTDLRCATEPWSALGLENTYPFTEGYSGRSIEDGGSDMYDGGNYISVHGKTAEGKARWEFELPYTQDCEGLFPTPTGIGDITLTLS